MLLEKARVPLFGKNVRKHNPNHGDTISNYEYRGKIMKILQVTSVFPPHIGGLEKCVYEISKRLALQGHEIVVYTTNFPQGKNKEFKDGVLIHRIPVFFTLFKAPVAIFLHHIMKEKVDLVHVHIPPIFGALSSIIFGKMKKVPVVLTYHNDTVGNSAIQRFVAKIYNVFQNRLILKNVTLITVPSQAYKIELARRGINRNRIRVVNNGIDFSKKNELIDTGEIRKRFGLHGEKLVLFVGALEKRKGVKFLIKAVPKISEEIKNVKVLIVGNGSEKKNLQNLAHDLNVDNKVFFTGYVTEEELDALYVTADVFVLPSLYETFALVLLEAMAHGKPVVATRIIGTSELVKSGLNGILVEPKNPEMLAEAIIQMLSEKDYAEQLGKNGELFSKNFSWEKAVLGYINVYQELYFTRQY